MSKIKISVVLVCMVYGFNGNIMAQIYSSGFEYYKGVDNHAAVIVEFHGSFAYLYYPQESVAKEQMKDNADAMEKLAQEERNRVSYDSELSTTKWTVYKRYDPPAIIGGWAGGWLFFAFNEDRTSAMSWIGGKESSRRYFIKVEKEYYLPKAANYDFLNE